MNLVTNLSGRYRLEPIEGKILSINGRVRVLNTEIPPYPKLLHLVKLNQEMLAQNKVNGYNVRLAFIPELNNFVAILRGGYICAKTTLLLREAYASLFLTFFKDHPSKVLVMEVLGKKSLANIHVDYYKENYGFEDIGFFIFDIMDLEKPEKDRFLSTQEVKRYCEAYNFPLIPDVGIVQTITELNQRLQKLPPVFEGAVLKTLDGKERWKYRFDQHPELFPDKIPKKEKRVSSPASIIVSHFFQGYGEPQLGLASGISQVELNAYQQKLDDAKALIAQDRSQVGAQSNSLVAFLMDLITSHGTFDQDQLQAIKKIIKKRVASNISKILRKVRAEQQ